MAAVECAFPSLPLCCTLNIFARLTCWERLRSRAVSRAWHATLSNGLLWRDVDLSRQGPRRHVRDKDANEAFLAAVGRVADGHITSLDISGQFWRDEATCGEARIAELRPPLHTFLAAHAGTIRHLVLRHDKMSWNFAHNFFQRAPREVERIEMELECTHDEAKSLLCREAPFEALHLQSLHIGARYDWDLHLLDFPSESALSLACGRRSALRVSSSRS